VRALLYLDARYLANQIWAILRSPGRLAIWVPWVFLLAYLCVRRVLVAQDHPSFFSYGSHALETAAAGSFFAALGIAVGIAASGRVTAFRSAAEALLFTNAGISPLSIALWLQLRKLLSTATRWLGSIVFSFVLIVPASASLGQLTRGFIAAVAVAATVMTAELPAFLLGRKRYGAALATAGWILAAVGLAYAALGFVASVGEERFAPAVLAWLHFDPGNVVDAVVANPPATLALCVLPLASFGALAWLGRDAVPELYAATLRAFEWRTQRRRESPLEAAASARAERIPSGARALVWKDWIGFRRSRGSLRRWALALGFWLGIGLALDFVRVYGDRALALPLLGFGLTALVLVPLAASLSLVDDLAKPLWWLSESSLRSRIIAWTFARSWRNGLAFASAPLALALAARDVAGGLLAVPVGIALWWSLNAIGVAFYAAFPSRIDARGPVFLLRAAATGLFFLPPAVVFGFAGMVAGSPAVAALAATAVILLEALLALEFAAYRFRENGAGIALLERA